MNSLEKNKQYKEDRKLAKLKEREVEKLAKAKARLQAKRELELQRSKADIDSRYEKKIAKIVRKNEILFEKNKRKIEWKKPLKKHNKPKTLAKYKQELFTLIQKYVRLRDSGRDWMGKCISCDRRVHYTEGDWWHYVSRKCMATAFDEMNINLQCKYCNGTLKGNPIEYRQAIINKWWGKEALRLENLKNTVKKRHISEIQEKIEHYKEQNIILEANKN